MSEWVWNVPWQRQWAVNVCLLNSWFTKAVVFWFLLWLHHVTSFKCTCTNLKTLLGTRKPITNAQYNIQPTLNVSATLHIWRFILDSARAPHATVTWVQPWQKRLAPSHSLCKEANHKSWNLIKAHKNVKKPYKSPYKAAQVPVLL